MYQGNLEKFHFLRNVSLRLIWKFAKDIRKTENFTLLILFKNRNQNHRNLKLNTYFVLNTEIFTFAFGVGRRWVYHSKIFLNFTGIKINLKKLIRQYICSSHFFLAIIFARIIMFPLITAVKYIFQIILATEFLFIRHLGEKHFFPQYFQNLIQFHDICLLYTYYFSMLLKYKKCCPYFLATWNIDLVSCK